MHRRKTGKHGRRKKHGSRAAARRLRDYEKTYVTIGGGTLSGGVSGSCRLLHDAAHRRSACDPPINPRPPVGPLAIEGFSSSGTMFIDPDPLCPSHGHLCRTQERPPRRACAHHPSSTPHSLLHPLDHWDFDATSGEQAAQQRCPGCDRQFSEADVCHCDCARPDVADVDRPPVIAAPLGSGGGSRAGSLSPPPPMAMLQTDDSKLQKSQRKSVAATNAASAAAATRRQSASMSLHASDDISSSAAAVGHHHHHHHSGEVEPLLVTAAVAYDDDDEADRHVCEVASPLRVVGRAICRNVEQRMDVGGAEASRTVA